MVGRALRTILFLAALAFVVKTGLDLSRAWDSHAVALDSAWLVAGLFVNALSLVCQGLAFVALLESWLGQELSKTRALSVFFASQLARYMPGKVGLPGARLVGANDLGGSKEQVLTATVVEVLLWLAVGGLCALAFFVSDPFAWVSRGSFPHAALIVILPPLAALALWIGSRRWSSIRALIARASAPLAARLAGPRPESPVAPLTTFLWFTAHWLLIILTGALLCLAIRGPVSAALPSGVTLVIAIVLGFLSLFAPGGVGIREAVLAACAAPLVGAKEAAVLGVLARAVSLGAELVLWAGFRLAAARRIRASEPGQ